MGMMCRRSRTALPEPTTMSSSTWSCSPVGRESIEAEVVESMKSGKERLIAIEDER